MDIHANIHSEKQTNNCDQFLSLQIVIKFELKSDPF